MNQVPKAIAKAVLESEAVRAEVEAAIELFRAAVLRGDAARVSQASEAALNTFQRYLDTTASTIAVARAAQGI